MKLLKNLLKREDNEAIGTLLDLNHSEMEVAVLTQLTSGKVFPEEEKYYARLEYDLIMKDMTLQKDSRQKLVYSHFDECMSVIHLLGGDRDPKIILAYVRSMDRNKYVSDIAFICRLGLELGASRAMILIGSLHTVK